MENKTPNQTPQKPSGKLPKFNLSWIYGLIILIILGFYLSTDGTQSKEVPFSTFEEYVMGGMIEKIDVFSAKNTVEAIVVKDSLRKVFGEKYQDYAKDRTINVRIPSVEEFSKFIQQAKDKNAFKGVVEYQESKNYIDLFLYSVFPFLLLIGFFIYMNRRMLA